MLGLHGRATRDFFKAKEHPTITFESTLMKKGDGDVRQIAGDLRMHGVTRTVTIPVELTGKGELPAGTRRAGVEATFVVQMVDELNAAPGRCRSAAATASGNRTRP